MSNVSKFEATIDGKLFQLFCENDAQIVHAKEFAFQFLKYMGQIEDAIMAQREQAKATESAPETPEAKPEG